MKIRIYIGFNFKSERFPEAKELFRRVGRNDLAEAPEAPFGYSFYFNKEAAEMFLAEAKKLGFGEDHISIRTDYIYTPSELETFPFFWFGVGTAPKGMGGPTYGTEYDFSRACPKCGTEAIQISPLYLKQSETPNKGKVFQTMDDEILVSPEIVEVLRKEGVTGIEFRTAKSHRERKDLPWIQIISTLELPPMAPETKGIVREDPCPYCNRDGYFHSGEEPVEITYNASSVNPEELPDVVHTYECFGNSRLREPFKDSHIAHPLLIVKPKVFKIFRREKVRGTIFEPVRVLGKKTEKRKGVAA